MSNIINDRIKKIEEIKNVGVEPFNIKGFDYNQNTEEIKKNKIARDINEIKKSSKENIKIAGRIVLYRSMGKLAFAHLQDSFGKIQVCFQKDFFKIEGLDEEKKSPYKFIEKLCDLGDFIGISGELFFTNHGELTIFVSKVRFLSKSIRPMPEKFHGVHNKEICYRERNLDLMMSQETMNRFKLRSKMIHEIRSFFHEKNFLEIETATLQSQAGGAMAKVFNTHHNALDHDFVLRIALELDLKRAIGGGMERVFEIGKNFRNEGIDPSHLQEFTMCEWYASYKNLEVNKLWNQEMFHRIIDKVFKKGIFKVLNHNGDFFEIDFSKKFKEASFPDLLKEYANIDMVNDDDEKIKNVAKKLNIDFDQNISRANLLDDIYKKTARMNLIQPTFVYNYPEDLKPLAAPNGDGTANCFQLVVNSWEIVNSYGGELINPLVQRKLLEEQMKNKINGDEEAMEIDEVFLKAMEHGFPPMTGCGFGIDRLIAIFTEQTNLKDVVLFPTMKPEHTVKN